ncbi:MAG: RNA polymerase sigma factor [Actinomycetota bacterium]
MGSSKRSVEGRPLEDAELADLARGGDVPAYEELVARYQGIAYRVAWLVARQAGEAEDAVQEAFVKAYYALPKFRPGAPFRPWLLRIVANEARNRVRSSRRREGLVLRAAAADPGDEAPSPEAAALEREDARTLTRAMERLRESDRLVIAYRYLFELSETEMADALGVRSGTVKSRLSRALGRLRAELETSGEVTR